MWLLQCCLLVQAVAIRAAYFHEPSMTTIQPSGPLADDAFFGYSIAFTNTGLVASAPRADKDGQVFSCNLKTQNCSLMAVPLSDYSSRAHNGLTYNHDFWLGASVRASDKHLFVCAPRSTSEIQVPDKVFGANGQCFYKEYEDPSSHFTHMIQITTEDRSINRTHRENVTDSFGWSMDIDTDGALRVGSPAIAAGRVMTYFEPSDSATSGPKIFTAANPDGFSFGYSIASGIFYKTRSRIPKPDVAIGTPYGDYGIGKVFMYNNGQKLQSVIDDPTGGVGSMFGAALCSAKLDGDTVSLLVGAPAHFSGDEKYHTGIVYVYRQHSIKTMKNVKQIKGSDQNGAFFGYAIANIGDMDNDGKDEIAIGAPYEDDGKGAVYLYAGSSLTDKSMTTSWLQRFQPEPASFQNVGLSLVANKYSENACSDLAIGAPSNNRVAVYHCLTVITVDIDTTFPNLQNRPDKTSFAFDVCLNAKYPSKPENIKAKFAVTVKISHPNATLSAAKPDEDFIQYEEFLDNKKNRNGCRSIKVTTSENGDYDQFIEFRITAKLLDDPANSKTFDPSKATVSSISKLEHTKSVRAAECKREPCQPKLSVKLTTKEKSPYLIGSSSTIGVDVAVQNGDADTAYRPCVVLSVDGGAAIIHRAPPHCTVDSDTRRVCQRQRALKPNSIWDLNKEAASDQYIEIGLEALTSDTKKIKVIAEVLNRCERLNGKPDDVSSIEFVLITNVDGLKIESKTDQGESVFFRKDDFKSGKPLHHTYTISNIGEINWVGLVGDFWLDKKPYITYNNVIQIYNGETERKACALKNDPKDKTNFHGLSCELGSLSRKETITVVIPITTVPIELDKVLQKSNATVKTFLRVIADKTTKQEKEKTEITTLVFQEGKVPVWIIVVAVCVGILIVGLIGFALYECGIFRRKKKEELVNLKQEVKRRSMMLQRQSMRLNDAGRAELRNRTYRELLDEAEIKEEEEARRSQQASDQGNINQAKGDNGCTSTVMNENAGSQYDIRAQIEKTLRK
ncbi:integrin alpha-PS3-like [Leguminivora glycinivorella]|uniref:integrin alpha-PS3-like n=1 Tax=Leguminivora glycinivorella TaxID=1035111 RepID=UPI00200CDF9B|nr:integrin alpha-PS3-like [Leguminivora glycinivorella]